MTTVETLLDLYLDMNILLVLAAGGWAALLAGLRRAGRAQCHQTLLQGTYMLFTAVVALPLLLICIGRSVPAMSAISLSDFAVAQFLDGRIEMSPAAFESILNLRSVLIRDVAAFHGPVGQGIALLIAAGLALGGLRLLRDIYRVHRLKREGYLLRRSGRVEIIISDTAKVPFSTRGLWTQYAIIPSAFLLRPGDLRIAVSHELQHIRQGDVTWEVLLEFLRPVFFWNPAFRYLKGEIEHRRELACDNQVLARRRATAAEYADCLLRTCERLLQSRGGLPTPTVPFATWAKTGSQRVLVTRFETLCQPVQTRGVLMPMAALTGLMMFVLLASAAMHASAEWSHDRIMLSTIVNLERLDSRAVSQVNW